MSQRDPSANELEVYCAAFLKDNDQTKAWLAAFSTTSAKPETIHSNASRFHKNPKVRARLGELRAISSQIATEKFTITVEQRIKWLKDIYEAGVDTYLDIQGNKRRESLTASRAAIETLNTMLGTSDNAGEVKPVKIFVGVKDAS